MLTHNLKNLLIFEDEGEGGGNTDMTIDLLWENPNPANAFPQRNFDILHIEDYKMLYMEFRPRAEFPMIDGALFKVDKNVPHQMMSGQVFPSTGDSTIRGRQFTYQGYSTVFISYGTKVQLATGLTASEDNLSCVPVRLYGIK